MSTNIIIQKHICLGSRLTRMRNSTVLPQRVAPLYRGKLRILRFFVRLLRKTELIYRNNCAKNSFNRVLVGTIVHRQFSTTFALKHSSGQWTRGSEDWVFPFCECQHHLLCNSVPFSLWTVSLLIDYHFFSDPNRRNDHCLALNLLANRETSSAIDSHSFLLSFDPHEMSLSIDMKMIFLVKFSGVPFYLNNNS